MKNIVKSLNMCIANQMSTSFIYFFFILFHFISVVERYFGLYYSQTFAWITLHKILTRKSFQQLKIQ